MSIGDAKSLKGRAASLFFAAVMLLIATIKHVDDVPSTPPTATDDISIFGMASAAYWWSRLGEALGVLSG